MAEKPRDYKRERKLAIKRGETGVGSKSGDATRHRARRKVENRVGRKLSPDEHVDHKKPLKSGGSNAPDNLAIKPSSKNLSHGGKIGNKAGKAKGGKKSKLPKLKP
ncbi:MAG: HNH endonuclease signature motif containing protein [Bacteroidales bacterium]